MQAERAAVFGGNMEDLPPEVEAEFLKNVQQFEDSFDNAIPVTIYECIGKPAYKKADETGDTSDLEGLRDDISSE